jgi:8-oxo-dGTP pyrophosphatase MutT (NUDIX family)
MHRRPLLDLIDRYARRHPEEAETVGRFRDFVAGNPDCFERSLAIGHVTGSAWILDAAGDRVLLTHHRKLNRWLQPGGHADGDPDVLAVALREGLEETGLETLVAVDGEIFDLDIHDIPARGEDPGHFHYDVRFLLRDTGTGAWIVSEESHALAWVALGELDRLTDEESIRRMREKCLQRLAAWPERA